MKHLFIMDMETTGLQLSDAVLELAFLHLVKERDFYRPGLYYRRVFRYGFPPASIFARTHHASLYDECRYADTAVPTEIQESIQEYFKSCGADDWQKRIMVGSGLSFKLEMLDRNRYLEKPQMVEFESGARQVGDYAHIIDLFSIGNFVADMFEEDRGYVQKKFEELKIEAPLPQSHRYRALFDCFVYMNRMNQYRLFFKAPWEFGSERFFEKDSQIQQHVSSAD